MIEKYKTVSLSNWTKITIKNSRFFSRIFYISKREESKKILKKTKQNHKKPTHIVYAYRIIENNDIAEFCTDSGEPANSSGPPILKVIKGKELLNICLVVVRYFGGTKLGIGGLIKAYTEAAQKAIKESRIVTKTNFSTIHLTAKYNELGTVISKIEKSMGQIEKIEYNDVIKITARVPVLRAKSFWV